MVVTPEDTRADLTEALTHLSHRAGRVICTDIAHAVLHQEINDLLDALERR